MSVRRSRVAGWRYADRAIQAVSWRSESHGARTDSFGIIDRTLYRRLVVDGRITARARLLDSYLATFRQKAEDSAVKCANGAGRMRGVQAFRAKIIRHIDAGPFAGACETARLKTVHFAGYRPGGEIHEQSGKALHRALGKAKRRQGYGGHCESLYSSVPDTSEQSSQSAAPSSLSCQTASHAGPEKTAQVEPAAVSG